MMKFLLVNIAKGKPAAQSSTYRSSYTTKNGNDGLKSDAITLLTNNPWWFMILNARVTQKQSTDSRNASERKRRMGGVQKHR